MTKRYLALCVVTAALLASAAALAATATYDYDALGRLSRVLRDDGKVEVYKLDDAGNRDQVLSGTLPGMPSSISVPPSSTTGAYTIGWGAASGTVTAYELYEATNSGFSGQTLVHSGTALSAALAGRTNGTYYYRVRACFDTECSAYRTGANGITVSIVGPPPIQILNPSISVGATGQITPITTLANLNSHAATIQSFSETCTKASVVIQSGAQAVQWTNSNVPPPGCAVGYDEYCSATYVIRNTGTGQTYPGMASITVVAQSQNPPPGEECP
jgi:YD repeat-containing protein